MPELFTFEEALGASMVFTSIGFMTGYLASYLDHRNHKKEKDES